MHVGSVMVFDSRRSDGFDYDRLVQLISARIAFVPRYRQRIREVPGRLANPVWVDDENFDVTYHVRRSALPQPGHRRAAAGVRRPDPAAAARPHPPAVGGLPGRGAGATAGSRSSPRPTRPWSTASTPSTSARSSSTATTGRRGTGHRHLAPVAASPATVELLAGARRRRRADAPARSSTPSAAASSTSGPSGSRAAYCRRPVSRPRWRARPPGPAPHSPLNAEIGAARRYVMVGDRPRRLPQGPQRGWPAGRYADDVTINDVVLATVAGALPRLAADPRRAGPPGARRCARWCPSASDADDRGDRAATGSRPASSTCRSGSPARRCGCTRSPSPCASRWRPARRSAPSRLAGLAGFAPPTLHSLGARLGSRHVAPAVQRRHHQRARPAAPAVRRRRPDARRPTPSCRWPRARRCRSG